MSSTNDKDTENMVLRTVFLPPSLDDRLRDVAFQRRVSKGDLIRSLVLEALDPTPSSASKAKPAASIAASGTSSSLTRRIIASHRAVAKKAAAKKVAMKKKAAKKVTVKKAVTKKSTPKKASAKKVLARR
ncbi:hypothetical protein [uncultured Stenotrophomonas sp.]|uniref:hypothetical protein n=1 Tax=uncultured Stenotrophomonas sp. TaxID=165438 RepID=UPI0025D9FC1F|nr:hypothetical protein [uncultured Stenotrophomonas sp.]